MLKGIPFVSILSKEDVYHFCLLCKKPEINLSKDLVRYIAKSFFYEWILLSDKIFYKDLGVEKHSESAKVYEKLKLSCLLQESFQIEHLPNIMHAYALSGKRIFVRHEVELIAELQNLGWRYDLKNSDPVVMYMKHSKQKKLLAFVDVHRKTELEGMDADLRVWINHAILRRYSKVSFLF